MSLAGEVAGFPLFDDRTPLAEVQAALEAHDLGDGLPLVPPTQARLAAMLAGVTCPQRSAGAMPPLFGELRPDAVAYQCVLAGCHPDELPVVWAAARACTDDRFNLLGILTTTGTPAIATLVHGPIARALAINASTNCLGPGSRANACIGRAISLVLLNVAGARPGVADMATMGQPGKYSFCFGEAAHEFAPSLACRRGLPADASAVTVFGVSGTAEVLPMDDAASPEAILRPMAAALAGAVWVSSGGKVREPAEQWFLLPPELADRLHAKTWSLAQTQAFLFQAAGALETARAGSQPTEDCQVRIAPGPQHIHPVITGGPGVKMTCLPAWAGGTASVTLAVTGP